MSKRILSAVMAVVAALLITSVRPAEAAPEATAKKDPAAKAANPNALPTHFIVYPEWMGTDTVLGVQLFEATHAFCPPPTGTQVAPGLPVQSASDWHVASVGSGGSTSGKLPESRPGPPSPSVVPLPSSPPPPHAAANANVRQSADAATSAASTRPEATCSA